MTALSVSSTFTSTGACPLSLSNSEKAMVPAGGSPPVRNICLTPPISELASANNSWNSGSIIRRTAPESLSWKAISSPLNPVFIGTVMAPILAMAKRLVANSSPFLSIKATLSPFLIP